MNYAKVTTSASTGRRLLDTGFPSFDLCEFDDKIVVRRILGFEDGRLFKLSLEGADELRKEQGLRESLPRFSHDENPDRVLIVEKLAKDEFEEMWMRAELVGDEWI